MAKLLSEDRDVWRTFRRIAQEIDAAIERELISATSLSGSDHGILSRLAETEKQAVRQKELCNSMRWDRTRLSHHLTRMERRGLVKRTKLEGGTLVRITAEGDRARKLADPVHADAVRKFFTSRLTATQRKVIISLAGSLSRSD